MARIFICLLAIAGAYYYLKPAEDETKPPLRIEAATPAKPVDENKLLTVRLRRHAGRLAAYAKAKGYNRQTAFLIDMQRHSGQKRFFIYDLQGDSVFHAGLVAHGSCDAGFMEAAQFSNTPECGCSSLGRYKVSYAYRGNFGRSYKLEGLDSSNSNAFNRFIVLHAYSCVPDTETFPEPICNSRGCPMVSYNFRDTLASVIDKSRKPILMWVYN
jgi:hypothetical protein